MVPVDPLSGGWLHSLSSLAVLWDGLVRRSPKRRHARGLDGLRLLNSEEERKRENKVTGEQENGRARSNGRARERESKIERESK